MKISPPIEVVAAELEAWALQDGWKVVGKAIADQYHTTGGGAILPVVDNSDGLRNAIQRVKRIFRGFETPHYASLAVELKPVVLSVLPAERRMKIESPDDPMSQVAVATREGAEATNAIILRAAPAVALKELNEAISAFVALRSMVESLCCADVERGML